MTKIIAYTAKRTDLPLIYRKHKPDHHIIGIWKITEDESYFLKKLNLVSEELEEFQRIKGRKRLEWLASRYLLQFLIGEPTKAKTKKDRYGKPFFVHEKKELSISHSWNMAAVIIGNSRNGIDIQHPVEHIRKIAHKFINEAEAKVF